MKKLLSWLVICCLLLANAAMAESAVTLPEVVVELGEDASLIDEQVVEGQGYMRQYSIVTSAVYVMVMNGEYMVEDVMGGLTTSEPTITTLISDEGGVKERKVYASTADNMSVDTAVIWKDGYTIALMLMSEKVTYEGANQSAWMAEWLEGMTVNGEKVVTNVAEAETATAEKLAAAGIPATEETVEDELIAIPQVEIDFGGEGVLVDENSVESAYMQTYRVGEHTVYVMEYLGEYLCDGVWQSIAFELPESQTLVENENGIRQRKIYDYATYNHTGDVTVVWRNGCTIAVVVSVANDEYEAGVGDTITGWLESMTIDGVPVMTAAE